MNALTRGKPLSRAAVTHLSTHGLWLLTNTCEIFVSFIDFPRLRAASAAKLKRVAQLQADSLYWPDLNIEIPVKQVRCFPLISVKPRPIRRSGRQAKM